ncbi:Putative RNA polymerase II transcriptional coactivator [Caenorhabditis elegans]|uniref:Putative RNA polymerase II transcriptional coactivator n=1 Tax=Caenorhabditis elegans TaxID=6239 RepID=TCP4_CAEEL|nr:Putative RNA polymerase II transcriptional coactivator [Caenorhabditis elegans]Q94045.1 RecName: Full=Putative RNA polymerase II transcriptional coactivator [Caenorhabditis elegans]CAB03353.1 Putative RNA polymerase II transcriptional coactivator [Caenorhabditis elegans]|eukprot:NP_501750.1 Putative RNA polymerase II transcriptional coactivator [Caenorhabditis elegans]
MSSSSSSEDELEKKVTKEQKKKETKSKKRQSEAVEEEKQEVKKAKNEEEVSGRLKDSDGNEMFEIGNLRYATVSKFKGKEYVNIREYYIDRDSQKMMPSRKGISLSKAQWANLKDLIPEIDKKF